VRKYACSASFFPANGPLPNSLAFQWWFGYTNRKAAGRPPICLRALFIPLPKVRTATLYHPCLFPVSIWNSSSILWIKTCIALIVSGAEVCLQKPCSVVAKRQASQTCSGKTLAINLRMLPLYFLSNALPAPNGQYSSSNLSKRKRGRYDTSEIDNMMLGNFVKSLWLDPILRFGQVIHKISVICWVIPPRRRYYFKFPGLPIVGWIEFAQHLRHGAVVLAQKCFSCDSGE